MIEKLRTSRAPEFASDLNLHSYEVNEGCSLMTISMRKNKNLLDAKAKAKTNSNSNSTKQSGDYDWKWLEDEVNCKSMPTTPLLSELLPKTAKILNFTKIKLKFCPFNRCVH